MKEPERLISIGYLCIQGWPKRICGGCTTACYEPVFVDATLLPFLQMSTVKLTEAER